MGRRWDGWAAQRSCRDPPRGDHDQQCELHSPSIAAVPTEQGIERSLQKVEICFTVGERARHGKNE